uniref:GRIP domain-containing protein n=1 Tax=Macrostomum lignano TaxID=282301 RepID=A0A1I8HMD0_9PLAT
EYASQKRELSRLSEESAAAAAAAASVGELREENACLQHDLDALVRAVKSARSTGRLEFDRGKFLALDPESVFGGTGSTVDFLSSVPSTQAGAAPAAAGGEAALAELDTQAELAASRDRVRQMKKQVEERDAKIRELTTSLKALQATAAKTESDSTAAVRCLEEKLRRSAHDVSQN